MQELSFDEMEQISGGRPGRLEALITARELAMATRFTSAVGLVYASYQAGYQVGTMLYSGYNEVRYNMTF